MEHDFPLEKFSPEKQDYLFRCSIAPENFPLERHKKSPSFIFQPEVPETFCKM